MLYKCHELFIIDSGVTIANDDYFELLIVNTWLKEDHDGFRSVYKEEQEVNLSEY